MSELTFRTFEADAANEFASRLAQAVAGLTPGYSPVVLFGPEGAGKSHLLGAIATELRVRHPDLSYLYLSDIAPVEYLLSQQTDEDVADQGYMYRPYADQKILIVDDLERFLRADLQGRFAQLFDAFFDSERLIVVACSQPPHALQGFDERFLSRLNSGVAAELGVPGAETRLRILKHEAERVGFHADNKALDLLAQLPVQTVGQLTAILQQVRLFCVVTGQAPAVETLEPLTADLTAVLANGNALAAEEWCAQWYARQLDTLREHTAGELREARELAATLEASLAEESTGTSAAKEKITKAAKALQKRDAAIARLTADLEKAEQTIKHELPRLHEVAEDKEARLEELREQAEADLHQFQTRLAETVSARDAAIAAMKDEAKRTEEEHAADEAALEQRLEEIYAALTDAQQDFAIQNQNKDKLLEKLSDDFQGAKAELSAARKQMAEMETRLTNTQATQAGSVQALEQLRQELLAERDAERLKRDEAVEKQIAALKRDHEHALATSGDVAATELEGLRRQVEAKEGALASITQDVQKKIADLERETKLHEKTRQELERATTTTDEYGAQVAELESAQGSEREATAKVQARVEELEAGAARAASELEEATAAAFAQDAAAEELEQSLAERAKAFDALRTRLEAAEAVASEFEAAAEAHAERETALATAQQQLQEARAAAETGVTQLAEFEESQAAAVAKRDEALAETSQLLEAARKAATEAEQAQAGREAQLGAELDDVRAELAAREKTLEHLNALAETHANEAEDLRRRVAAGEGENLELRKHVADRDALAKAVMVERGRTHQLESDLNAAEERAEAVQTELESEQEGAGARTAELTEHVQKQEALAAEREAVATQAQDALMAREAELERVTAAAQTAADELAAFREAQAGEFAELDKQLVKAHEATEQLEERHKRDMVAVAKRAQEIAAKLTAADAAAKEKAAEAGDAVQRLAQVERAAEDRAREAAAHQARLAAVQGDLKATSSAREAAERALADYRAAHETATAQTEQALAAARDEWLARLTDVQKTLDESNAERNQLAAELTERRAGHAALEAQYKMATTQVDQMRAELAGHEARAAQLEEQVAAQSAVAGDRSAQEADLAARHEELVTLRQELATLKATFDTTELRAAAAQQELDTLRPAHEKLGAEAAEVIRRETAAQSEAGEARAAVEQVRVELAARSEALTVAEQKCAEMEAARADAQAQGDADARELQRDLAAAQEAADTGTQTQVIDLQAKVAASEQALRSVQENFGTQLAEADAKARAKQTALTTTVRELQAQLNQVQVVGDDRESEADALRADVARLRAQLDQAEAASGVPPASPPRPAKPTATTPAPGTGAPLSSVAPPLETVALSSAAPLNPEQTFDTFEATEAGAFSVRSARQVTQTPGELYNPFVVYGPANAGKTHILHAMANAILSGDPDVQVTYVGVPELLAALAGVAPDTDMDTIVLEPDVLLIDDFDIGAVEEPLQLRLANVLSNFVNDGRQLVIASAVPPVKMTSIARELMRFLEEGLLVKFDPNLAVANRRVDDMAETMDAADAPTPPSPVDAPPPTPEPTPVPEPPAEPERPPEDPFASMLALDPGLLRAQYRGPKAFDDLLAAYAAPNSNRRSRFPLIVVEDDRAKLRHFFHALGNELTAQFNGATVALLSFSAVAEALRVNPAFDPDQLAQRLLQADIVLLNDGDAVQGGPLELEAACHTIVQTLLDRDKLFTLGLHRADKRDKVFGTAVRSGTKKKI